MTLNKGQIQNSPASRVDVSGSDRASHELFEPDTGRSNFVAFLLGGFLISGGLLAFLYIENDTSAGRDVTGSLGRIETPAPSIAPKPAILAPTKER
jgi:hypothetical protein